MSTPREQYDSMLEDLDDETKVKLIEHVFANFVRFYSEECPVDYRCGMADFQAQCDECHHEFWADDPDEDAVCDGCKEAAKEEEEEEE